MIRITYRDLITTFGVNQARQVLRTLEMQSLAQGNVVALDLELRLRNALEALNRVGEACSQ